MKNSEHDLVTRLRDARDYEKRYRIVGFIPFYKVDSYYRNTVNQSVPVIPLSPYPRQVVLECTVKRSENLVSKPEHITKPTLHPARPTVMQD